MTDSKFDDAYTCFDGHRRLASGPLQSITHVVKCATEDGAAGPILIFDNNSGRQIDIDIRGAGAPAAAPARIVAPEGAEAPRGRGRPKLGVVAREVTLLPRHWEWLASQPGGASVALRKLVEHARRDHAEQDALRQAQERAYSFMSAMAGDFPGFEEAARALFANNDRKFRRIVGKWPADVRDHVILLAYGAGE